MDKVAIIGGTGLVGRALMPHLRDAGFEAFPVGRPYQASDFEEATAIINLAGENLSAGRWTPERKKRILQSRVQTLATLRGFLESGNHRVKTLLSASASGYYGTVTTDRILTESDPAGRDFLAGVCRAWEAEADTFEPLGIRVAKVRIGVVFSADGGALQKMMLPLRFGISAPLGSGKQWIPWIHIDDLAGIFVHLLKNRELTGAFNAASPEPVTNRELMKTLARLKHRLYIPVGVPGFLLKAILGEMAVVTLQGSRLSAERIMAAGYDFKYPELGEALMAGGLMR
jgi:uncharacterized protein (TIGR01777 family)